MQNGHSCSLMGSGVAVLKLNHKKETQDKARGPGPKLFGPPLWLFATHAPTHHTLAGCQKGNEGKPTPRTCHGAFGQQKHILAYLRPFANGEGPEKRRNIVVGAPSISPRFPQSTPNHKRKTGDEQSSVATMAPVFSKPRPCHVEHDWFLDKSLEGATW